MKNYFIISDIHGQYKAFEKLLTYWNPKDSLVLLGDLIDRGPRSYEVVQKVMELKRQYGEQVIFCKGNHEMMLLDFLGNPGQKHAFYYKYGGRETMASFLKYLPVEVSELDPIEQAQIIKEKFAEELDFLNNGKLFEIAGNLLLTHAGFDSSFATVDKTEDENFLWIRQHYKNENKTPYINIFGHTPLQHIHGCNDIWISKDQKYIGIDGGCYFTGQLNGIVLSEEGQIIHIYAVTSDKTENYDN